MTKIVRFPVRLVPCVAASVLLIATVPARADIITVGQGSGYEYATLAGAVAAASANDVIQVAAGTYTNDFATITVPLTIDGVGGPVIFNAAEQIPNGKAIIVSQANLTVNGLTFENASVADNNGEGIRVEAGNLLVENSSFLDNQEGILVDAGSGINVTVDNSSFDGNGDGSGFTHAIYAGMIDSLTVEDSTFEGTQVGHDIKSRAAVSDITDNILDDGVTGTTSYAIDLPDGGVATITDNVIDQGPNTQNPVMVSYGEEGNLWATNSLSVIGNTFDNTLPGFSVGVHNATDISALLEGNTFSGVEIPLLGPGQIVDSVPAPSAFMLVGLGLVCAWPRRRTR